MRSRGGKLESQFVPVTTGITGSTDIEVTSGLKDGEEIVIGPYKVLRTLKNDVKLKRDTAPAAEGTESS
jgi:HlyD family secretion protein